MPLSVRNMIAILVTIVILLGVFFIAAIYYPTNKQARRMARMRAVLEAQVESTSPGGGEAERETEIQDAMAMDINFFKKRNLSPKRGVPDLLEQINRMGNQMNIQFVAVKPLEEEDAPGYRHYPFLIETRAAYPELVNFVHRMENGLRLSLTDLRIETDKKDRAMHHLQFTLNIFELKDDTPSDQGESAEKQISPQIDMELLAVERDPFSPKKRIQVAPVPKKPKVTKVAAKKPKPPKPKLVLMGIMDIAGNRVAIINDKPLRVGQTIREQRIDQIEADHVIIAAGDRTYPLYLKGLTPRERREVKR